MADWTPESRVEEILYDTINGEEYNGLPESRIEELLLELKEVIEAGGGGGGTTNYNLLENKPQIGSVTLSGNKTLDELGLSTELRKVMDMITGQFSTESDYSEGDIVIHDKTLYVFVTDHTAGQWNDLEVSQTTIEDLISSIVPVASSLSDLTDTAITSPTNGQILSYNSTTGKWENTDGGETKDTVGYRFVTKSTGGHDATITVSKYLNGVLDSSTDYGYASVSDNPTIIDGYISFVYKSQQTSWEYTILKDSLSGHSVGYSYSWGYLDTIDAEEEFYISEDTLAGLNDVAIVSPTAAQPLTYDSTNDMWVNGGIIPAANGGTGNTSGYIRTGIRNNTTVGNRATAEGNSNQSSADDSHAEGASNNATGNQSHAEGFSNTASGNYSHAEGANTTASGTYSHAEGMLSRAAHNYAHAEGSSVASAQAAHSEGEGSLVDILFVYYTTNKKNYNYLVTQDYLNYESKDDYYSLKIKLPELKRRDLLGRENYVDYMNYTFIVSEKEEDFYYMESTCYLTKLMQKEAKNKAYNYLQTRYDKEKNTFQVKGFLGNKKYYINILGKNEYTGEIVTYNPVMIVTSLTIWRIKVFVIVFLTIICVVFVFLTFTIYRKYRIEKAQLNIMEGNKSDEGIGKKIRELKNINLNVVKKKYNSLNEEKNSE